MFPKQPHTAPPPVPLQPGYGPGVEPFEPGWAPHLGEGSPIEVLHDLQGLVFKNAHAVDPRRLTVPEVTEAVRRAVEAFHPDGPSRGFSTTYSLPQCLHIAQCLLRDAGCWDVVLAWDGAVDASDHLPGRVDVVPNRGPHKVTHTMPSALSVALTAQTMVANASLYAVGFRSRTVLTAVGTWHVLDSDPASTVEPLVLLHGLFTTSASMALLGVLLAPYRRVVMPDLLDFDFGYSKSHAEGDFVEWGEHVDATAALLKALGGALDVMGHSFGGWLAVRIADKYPELVRRLVLLAPGGLGRYRPLRSMATFSSRRRTAEAVVPHPLPGPVGRLVADGFQALAYSSTTVRMLRSLDFKQYFQRVPIRVPALLLWGRDDRLHTPWATGSDDAMMRDVLHGEGYWVEAAGHMLPVDSTVAVCDAACRFLGLAEPRPAAGVGVRAFAKGLRVALAATTRTLTPMRPAAVSKL